MLMAVSVCTEADRVHEANSKQDEAKVLTTSAKGNIVSAIFQPN